MNPPYSKRPLLLPEQISLLQKRGVIIEDKSFAEHVLSNVGYYRFSAYLYPFRKNDGTDDFFPGTSFQKCWEYYHFDRKLRLCVLDAVERVEVAIKARVAYTLSTQYGPFSYRNLAYLKDNPKQEDVKRYKALLHFVEEETANSQEEFVKHFLQNYDSRSGLPIWMAVGVMSFGNIFTLFHLMKKKDQDIIARAFGSNEKVFLSWLRHLHYIRNICAHHGRLWNRFFAIKAVLPKDSRKNPSSRWHEAQYPVNTASIYSTLCIFKALLDVITPQSQWKLRVYALMDEFPNIPRAPMGIPNGFEQSAIWK